ncbi:MAG TPA: hypothetical protein PLK77_14340, partial [Pyrinomonadaceae bacterium]|nr:hypothetical protein [Pyrinomonadaceae bacterium]
RTTRPIVGYRRRNDRQAEARPLGSVSDASIRAAKEDRTTRPIVGYRRRNDRQAETRPLGSVSDASIRAAKEDRTTRPIVGTACGSEWLNFLFAI